MHNLALFVPAFLSKFMKNIYVFLWLKGGCAPLAMKLYINL